MVTLKGVDLFACAALGAALVDVVGSPVVGVEDLVLLAVSPAEHLVEAEASGVVAAGDAAWVGGGERRCWRVFQEPEALG